MTLSPPQNPVKCLVQQLHDRTRAAFSQPLNRIPWAWFALWTLLYLSGVFAWGCGTGFLKWQLTSLPPSAFLRTSLILVLFPGIAEELVFRVWLLPHPRESVTKTSLRLWLVAGAAVFLLWHVVNAWLFFPIARPVFWDWRFLTITAWLGWVCGLVYVRSGTIWAPVFLHWVTVVVWKACFGGPVFFE